MINVLFGVLALAFALAANPCSGQKLVLCSSGLDDSLLCSRITLNSFFGTGGRQLAADAVLYKGQILIRRVCLPGNGVVLVGFGNEHSNGEAFTLTCVASSPDALFNSYRNGVREGLWFHQNLFGTISKVEQYRAGQRQSVLRFWPNGLPRQRVFYRQGKPRRGQKRYDKQGYLLNGRMPF